MRGKLGDELSIYGDIYYDLSKVYQSLLGYDFIINDIELDNVYIDKFILFTDANNIFFYHVTTYLNEQYFHY